MIISKRIFILCLAVVVTGFRCSMDSISSGTEITNGKCAGVIYDQDNRKAEDVTVRLIPAGYDPTSPARLDSTTTDHEGRYSFTIRQSDFYTVFAEKGNASCMQDSISLSTDKPNNLENDTLEESGWLAGNIQVKPDNDPQLAIVLVLGTNRYTSPTDSLGTLSPVALPAGNHTVRIFTTESGYDVFDTTISIYSGDTTFLGARIPTSYAPAVNNFTVVFDSVTLNATLTWEPVDTALITSYLLYRLVNGIEDTIGMIDNQLSEYADECIPFYEDTLCYEIAAVGPTYKEGYKVTSLPVVICGKTLTIEKIPLKKFTSGDDYRNICVDADENIYLFSGSSIVKIDPDGTVLAQVNASTIGGSEDAYINSITIDTYGNLYVYIRSWASRQSLFKLDSDFNTINSLPIPDSCICVGEQLEFTIQEKEKVIVGDDGSVYVHSSCDDTITPSTTIRVYDPDFNLADIHTIAGTTCIRRAFGDTIMAIRMEGPYVNGNYPDRSLTRQTGIVFDRSFTILSTFEAVFERTPRMTVWPLSESHYLTVDDYNDTTIVSGAIGIFPSVETVAKIFTVYRREGALIGKQVFPEDCTFQFRSSALIFGISHSSGPVLYRISFTPTPAIE